MRWAVLAIDLLDDPVVDPRGRGVLDHAHVTERTDAVRVPASEVHLMQACHDRDPGGA